MQVQPIANYEQRCREYKRECKQFWRGQFLAFAVIGAVLVFGIIGYTNVGARVLGLDWKVFAAMLWAVLMIPPFFMMRPKRPYPDDVLKDQALRRAFDMDDTVSKDM